MTIDKEDVLEKLKEQMEELNQIWRGERGRLEELARQASAGAAARFEKELEELGELRMRLKEKVIDLEVAGENAWEEVREGADAAWQELKEALKKAGNHFSQDD
jgi:predicted PilT family ATPase